MSTTTLPHPKVDQFLASLPGIGGRWFKTDDGRLALDLPENALTQWIEGIEAEHTMLFDAAQAVANRQIDGTAHAAIKMFMMASNLSTCTVDVNHLAMQAEGYNLTAVVLEDGRVQFTLDAAAG